MSSDEKLILWGYYGSLRTLPVCNVDSHSVVSNISP